MKPHLPIKLFVALCAAISAVAATTQAAITVTNITQWDGYDQAAGAAHVGNIDGTIYNAKQQQDYLWNNYWNFIYTVDAATLTEGTYSLDTVALTQFGEEGYVVASSLVMGSDGTGTVSLGGWNQPAATAEVDLSNAKDITFVLSRNTSGGIVSLTGYVDGNFDSAPAFTLPISGVNLTFQSGYVSTVRYGSTGGLTPFNNGYNTYRQVADDTVGSFDITKAGYLLGSPVTAMDLGKYYSPVITLEWNGEAPSATWDTTSESWLDGEQPALYVSGYGTTAYFNTGDVAKDVTVSGDIKAAVVNVNDDYTFTAGSGSSLMVDTLNVADGKTATLSGEGHMSIDSLTGAGTLTLQGPEVSINGVKEPPCTVTVSGGILHLGENAIIENLTVTNGEVTTMHSGEDGAIRNNLSIGGGGVFRIIGDRDAFGWGAGNQSTKEILMQGTEECAAVLSLEQTTSYTTTISANIRMGGYSSIISKAGTQGFNTFGCSISAQGIQNHIDLMSIREAVTVDVAEASVLEIGAVTEHYLSGSKVLTKTGEGSLSFTGNVLMNGLNVNEGTVSFTGGSSTLDALCVLRNTTLQISGANTVVSAGGTANTLSSTLYVNAATLNLNGTFAIDENNAEMTESYSGGENSDNGFRTASGRIIVYSVENGGSVNLGNNAHITYEGVDVKNELEHGVYVAEETTDYTTFYVNSGEENVSQAKLGSDMQNIRLAKGTTLNVDEDFEGARIGVVSGTATVDIAEHSAITGTMRGVILSGKGTYSIDRGTSFLGDGVTFDEDWTGTVLIGGFSSGDGTLLNELVNGNKSILEINGITGGFLPERNGGTITANIKLSNPDSNTPAWSWTSGTGGTAANNLTFSGAWSGNGTFRKSGSYNQSFTFTGNISEWCGTFEYSSSSSYTTNLTFKGNATEVNAVISKPGSGTLNIIAGDGAETFSTTFARNVTATRLEVMEHATATMEGSTNLASIGLPGDATLINDGTLYVNGTITFGQNAIQNNGTVTFGSSIHFDLRGMEADHNVYTLFSGEAVDLSRYNTNYITVDGGTSGKQWHFGTDGTISAITPSDNVVWTARESRRWNTTDANWEDDGYISLFQSGAKVSFYDTGSGEVVLQGNLAPQGVLVENSANHDYIFSGSGKLTGTMQLCKDGDGSLIIGTVNDYTGGTILEAGTLKAGSASAFGSGIIQVSGGKLDLNGYTIANQANASGEVTIGNGRLNGNLTVDNATLTIDEDLTLGGNLVVQNENRIEVADGATLYLMHTITNENYIEFAGRIDISAITGTVTGSSYVGAETKGNGFLQTGYEMMLIDCGLSGDFKWSEAEIYHSGNEVAKEEWGGVTYSVTNASNFYIFSGTENVSTAHSLDVNTRINLSGGTMLNVDEDVNLSQVQASGAASINIEEGKELSGYFSGNNLTLSGTGVYELDSRTSLGSLVLGSEWTGTVRLTGSASSANFNSMARAGSWLELKGFSGYPSTYNGTTSVNIILTDKEDGTAAFTATYGYSYDYGYTMKFTGAIKGEGSFIANAASNRYENYEFAGDIAEWSGVFRYASGRNTKLTISGNANVVNAAIDGIAGLTLCVNTNATFNEAASLYGLTLNSGSATFNDFIQVRGNVSAAGTSSLIISDGQTLSLGSAISNSGNLTLSGAFDVSGRTSVLLASEYSGGATPGNGYGLTLYGVQVVQNSGSATLDWSAAEVIYDTPGYEKRADGFIVQGFNDGQFHVMTGTESVSTAQDAAEEAGITMQGVELKNGTTLTVDRDFATEPISVVSGTAYLNVEAGSTLQSDGAVRADLSLKGEGTFKLAAGSTAQEISWDSPDWHGTVMLTDVTTTDLNLNTFGHEDSKVELDGVSGNFARPSGEIIPTLVLSGDGLSITACYTNSTYTFAGGVEGSGNWTYALTARPNNQTYIITGDVSEWTGAYISDAEDKTSTLQFYGDATEMGAAIRQTAGTVNVVVGGEIDEDGNMVEHSTAFENEVEATDFTVKENATAVIENKATVTGSMKLDGTLELADGGSLALSQDAAVQVGEAYTLTGKGDTAPALSGNLEITEDGFRGIGDKAARIDHSVIKLEEGASVVFDNVILGASSQLKDDPATVVVNNMVIEGILGENVQEGAPLTIKSGSVLHLTGNPGQTVVIEEDSFACTFDITNVQDVQLSGNCLTIDLSSMYPKFKDMGESFDWLGIALGSGDHAPTIDENLEVVVQTLPNQRAHGYVGWGGTFVTIPDHGENVGPVIYFHMYEVPEPTTSTMSLLALAALAARRRRK